MTSQINATSASTSSTSDISVSSLFPGTGQHPTPDDGGVAPLASGSHTSEELSKPISTGQAGQTPNPVPFSEAGRIEGGEGGATVLSPPLPPLQAPISANGGPAPTDIYRPAPSANPVLAALHQAGLYRGAAGHRMHQISCPWAIEHSAEGTNAKYHEPAGHAPLGRFECMPCRHRNRHIGTLLDHLGVGAAEARCKPIIRMEKGEHHQIADAAEKVLAESGAYYHTGGTIVSLRTDAFTGETSTQLVVDQAATIVLSAAADWESYDGRSKSWQRVDVPARVVSALMKKGQHRYLRQLNGIARQPFFRVNDDQLVETPGYDVRSGMYAAFDAEAYDLPEPTETNARAALAGLKSLLDEFHFATPSDGSAALSAMLAASIRPSLRVCPAFSVSASRPGSGKSYLASLIGRFAGPSDAHNTSYPTSSEEASKLVLSLMLTSPAVVCFDDMTSDWMAYGAINRLLTSETITERVLGASKMAAARTTSLILGTGNNIRPLRDMARRVVSIYLNPRVETITSLRYTRNPVEMLKADRKLYVGYALTVISAYIAAGSPRADVPTVQSYDDWSRLCRDSLIWLGEPDPAASLLAQVNEDPDIQAFGELLAQWYACFRERQTMIRTLLDRAEQDNELIEALLELPVTDRGVVNRSKLGRYLARHANRIVNGYELLQAATGERNAWKVVATDESIRDLPPSPRESPRGPVMTPPRVPPPSHGATAPGEIF